MDTLKILCSKTHEYALETDSNTYLIGLTDYAIEQLGDIVFLELPEVGSTFNKGDMFATVESVKAASEIYMPISGTVTEINEEILTSPELLNEYQDEKNWLIKVDFVGDNEEFLDLMDYDTYREEVE
ncbi:glycine cleavage system protein GcvH [bacterium]|nr:glycine cleavage system protein GcvH [bacterium]